MPAEEGLKIGHGIRGCFCTPCRVFPLERSAGGGQLPRPGKGEGRARGCLCEATAESGRDGRGAWGSGPKKLNGTL